MQHYGDGVVTGHATIGGRKVHLWYDITEILPNGVWD